MKQIKKYFPWVMVILWMVVIFLFSAQTGDSSGNTSGEIVKRVIGLLYRNFAEFSAEKQTKILEVAHLLIRKGAHFTEYAVLAMLVANALRMPQKWWIPIVFCALYALSDEIHQYFVPDRACRLLDVCIDTAGGAFGTAAFALLNFAVKRAGRKR